SDWYIPGILFTWWCLAGAGLAPTQAGDDVVTAKTSRRGPGLWTAIAGLSAIGLLTAVWGEADSLWQTAKAEYSAAADGGGAQAADQALDTLHGALRLNPWDARYHLDAALFQSAAGHGGYLAAIQNAR